MKCSLEHINKYPSTNWPKPGVTKKFLLSYKISSLALSQNGQESTIKFIQENSL